MDLQKANTYTIVDKDSQVIGELYGAVRRENWYQAKVRKLELPDLIQKLFDQVDMLIRSGQYKKARQLEAGLDELQLRIQETGDPIAEFQLAGKTGIYLKLREA